MSKDKDIKKKGKKAMREKKPEAGTRCCYVVDPCGCTLDTRGCFVDLCC